MPILGRYRYPYRGLESSLKEIQKAETALKHGMTRRGLADALGVKYSGWFFEKIADMKMYGLIEGRGTVKLTELADKILHGITEDEKRQAKETAWLTPDAIRLVHEIFKGKVPSREEEYLAIVGEKSGEKSRAKLPQKARQVLTLYKESLKDILIESLPEEVEEKNEKTTTIPALTKTLMGIIEIKAEDYYQRLPYSPEGIDIAINFLTMLKAQLEGYIREPTRQNSV